MKGWALGAGSVREWSKLGLQDSWGRVPRSPGAGLHRGLAVGTSRDVRGGMRTVQVWP